MAETRIADVVVPEVFSAYTSEASIFKSRFFRSSVIQENGLLSSLLGGGGTTFNLPFWKNVAQTESDIPVEASDATINNITSGQQIGVRLERLKAWGSQDIAALLAGSDPLAAIQGYVVDYWAQDYDKSLVAIADGVIADNIANDSSDLVNVTATVFSDDGVIDAQALLGENGTIGRNDLNNGDFNSIAVHPDVYALMRKQDAITFVPISGQDRPLPFYMGMSVVVDRNLTVAAGAPDIYTTIIFKSGAFAFGINGANIQETEIYRNPAPGMGVDELYTRRNYMIHPMGFAWTGTAAGVSPTNAEMAVAASWNRVYEAENIGFVAYQHSIV